jgi:ribosomal protein L37AE/L43A
VYEFYNLCPVLQLYAMPLFSPYNMCSTTKKKNHILHQHMLTLHSDAPYAGGVYICNACGHSRHGFTYRCDRCDFDLDVQCCSIPEILKHEGHQHSIFLPVSSNKNCNACDHNHTYYKDTRVFICTTCDFALGFECATLPLVAKHKYDEHPLALTYVAENNSGEYYCLICEEKRDSNIGFIIVKM